MHEQRTNPEALQGAAATVSRARVHAPALHRKSGAKLKRRPEESLFRWFVGQRCSADAAAACSAFCQRRRIGSGTLEMRAAHVLRPWRRRRSASRPLAAAVTSNVFFDLPRPVFFRSGVSCVTE